MQAFLNVPLYRQLYNDHKGSRVPGPSALEQEMKILGVAPNQLATARRVFMDSARQAGFFDEVPDRLIEPAIVAAVLPSGGEPEMAASPERADARRVERGGLQHPLIEGLFTMLPPPGGRFTAQEQARWLEAAKVNLALVYGIEGRNAPAHAPGREQERKG